MKVEFDAVMRNALIKEMMNGCNLYIEMQNNLIEVLKSEAERKQLKDELEAISKQIGDLYLKSLKKLKEQTVWEERCGK